MGALGGQNSEKSKTQLLTGGPQLNNMYLYDPHFIKPDHLSPTRDDLA